MKVGSTAEIEALKGPSTRVIDVAGRTVIPGLIDNHAHWVRAAEHDELRFDGVTSRQQALKMLAERVRATKPGEWIAILGGWSEEQFTDDPRGFPLEELDRIAPNNPVAVQAPITTPISPWRWWPPRSMPTHRAAGRDREGCRRKADGLVRGAGGVAWRRIPLDSREAWLANAHKLAANLSAMPHGAARCRRARHGRQALRAYRHLADRGELNIRLFGPRSGSPRRRRRSTR